MTLYNTTRTIDWTRTCANRKLFLKCRGQESPVINPALVIRGWGERDAELKLNGNNVERDKDFRFGHHYTLEGTDLIVWIKTESTKPIKLSLSPAAD